MVELEFDELVTKIVSASGMTKDDVIARINAKINELSGLVSKKGAAHIIASSLGIQIYDSKKGKLLELKDLVDGLTSVSVKGVVTRIFPINEFEREGRKGKVGNVVINDGTAEVRLVFWNETTDILTNEHLNVNDFIKIHHLRSKKGNYGMELHFTSRSRIELNTEEEPPKIKSFNGPQRVNPSRYLICDLQDGIESEVRGTIVQVSDRSLFYDTCPKCAKSVKEGECKEHGKIEPVKSLKVNLVLDDGTGNIRCVFFKQQAEALLGLSSEKALSISKEKGNDAAILEERQLIGEEIIVSGKVNHNDYSDQSELMARTVNRAEALKEIERLTNLK